VELADGDRLMVGQRTGSSAVRVLLFHGLSGDINSDYMRRAAAKLGQRGHGVWAVNHRGCGTGRELASHPYHSGVTDDLQAVLAASRRQAPHLLHLVVGFSLSGNLALLHAAEQRPEQPDGLIAVNPPVHLERATLDLQRGLNRLYELRFMIRLRRAVRDWQLRNPGRPRYRIPWTCSLLEFDDRFTAPECGFSSGLDYYRRCSSVAHLGEIRVPSVILSAADDPFVNPEVFARVPRSEQVLFHLEGSGGHVGYLSKGSWGWQRWLDQALVHYVEELARQARSPPETHH
jgi:hypothetical protein